MGQRAVTAQKPFKMIVGALKQGSDPSRGPSGNPVVAISTYTRQSFPEIPGRGADSSYPGIKGTTTRTGLLTGSPTAATGEITCAVNQTFLLGPTSIHLGEHVLTSNVEWIPSSAGGPGSFAATATAIAAAISKLDGYSAVAVGPVVQVTGPVSIIGNESLFRASGVSPWLLPITTAMAGGQPSLGPPTIT